MKNRFIEKTVIFLAKSNIGLHFPRINELELKENGAKHVYIRSMNDLWQSHIDDNLMMHILLFYSLLDAYIDYLYPKLEKSNFINKFKNIPANDDYQIILKEIYRVLQIFRNGLIRDDRSLSFDEESGIIKIKYKNNNIDYMMELKIYGLELIYTTILYSLKENENPDKYKIGILRTFFDDINKNILALEDNFSNGLFNISSGIRLKRDLRYKVLNPEVKYNKYEIVIKKIEDNMFVNESYDIDYIINNNDIKYIIPNELLKTKNSISLNELEKWKVKEV